MLTTFRSPGAARIRAAPGLRKVVRSEEHTSELQSHLNLVCRLLLEKKKMRLMALCTVLLPVCVYFGIAFWKFLEIESEIWRRLFFSNSQEWKIALRITEDGSLHSM